MYSKKEDLEDEDLERPFIIISETKNPPIYKLNVLGDKGMDRCNIDQNQIIDRKKIILENKDHYQTIARDFYGVEDEDSDLMSDVDGELYTGGFFSDSDKNIVSNLNVDNLDDWSKYRDQVQNIRLKKLINRVLARNFPEKLTIDQKEKWIQYVNTRLTDNECKYGLSINKFDQKLKELLTDNDSSHEIKKILIKLNEFVKEFYNLTN